MDALTTQFFATYGKTAGISTRLGLGKYLSAPSMRRAGALGGLLGPIGAYLGTAATAPKGYRRLAANIAATHSGVGGLAGGAAGGYLGLGFVPTAMSGIPIAGGALLGAPLGSALGAMSGAMGAEKIIRVARRRGFKSKDLLSGMRVPTETKLLYKIDSMSAARRRKLLLNLVGRSG